MTIIASSYIREQIKVRAEIIICLLVSLLSIVVALYLWGARSLHITNPIYYYSDAIVHLAMIQNLMEGPWVYASDRLGTPFGSVMYDYPIPDSGTLLALKILSQISHSAGLAYNIYYFAGFSLDAVAAYMVLRQFGVGRPLSFSGGFIFSILPFHFMRIAHLFYTWYFSVPIFTWYSLRAYRGSLDFFNGESSKTQIIDGISLLLLSCFGVYYSVFGSLAILAATLVRYLESRSISAVRGGMIAASILFAGIVINVSPTLVYRYIHGVDREVAARSAAESELYGLKITQLLLPHPGHRFKRFDNLTQQYDASFPLVNENDTSSLGLIGGFGFIALLVLLGINTNRRGEILSVLALLTLAFILVSTIGGFSSLFALLVSPMIRAWNRASVFVAFFSLSAAMLILQSAFARANRIQAALIAAALCCIALWDQTITPPPSTLRGLQNTYESDRDFVKQIEQILPSGSSIYQLPYAAFPEVPPINNLAAYDQLAGYLNSTSLRWSFGGMKGREGDLFFRQLSVEPLAQQVGVVREKGFSGIWIDRRGYVDHGKAVESELTRVLGKPPALISPNGNQSFFTLRGTQSDLSVR